ncbi:hypothetical protein ACFSHT_01145 [Paraburkholderia silviterrae]|uniref:Uncharacterized protein n=1 Tax=Paraburkholderia silviterrae TaxID=2528715 RepID=A0A4R5MFY0_9BURK|nr:hypothetical protein [Paraburkholderia silviterrae]TDG26211.1 hypothetical protein EYW47_02345 [Paraburkholderia silviterrae]
MNTATLAFFDTPGRATPVRDARLQAARLNPLSNVILAFWAIWHCRHARPPLRPQQRRPVRHLSRGPQCRPLRAPA